MKSDAEQSEAELLRSEEQARVGAAAGQAGTGPARRGVAPDDELPEPQRHTSAGRFVSLLMLVCLLAAIGFLLWQHDQVSDWLVSRGYQPSAAVRQLASEDTLTPYARRLFYVNKPQIESADAFNKHCSNTVDQVTVLGCFVGNRLGIYVYDVTDSRLDGIQQVTAAHEMLHQAYERLSPAERQRIDTELTAYAKTITDADLKDKLATYQKTEPHDIVNEMHSLFGTEVVDLPPALETYYQRYFTNRHAVTQFHDRYQEVFTERTEQIASYDAQLADLKTQIDTNRAAIDQQEALLQARRAQLDAYAANNQIADYNAAVPGFNGQVDAQKARVSQTNTLINRYNDLVDARNAIAVQKRQLQQAIDSHAGTDSQR